VNVDFLPRAKNQIDKARRWWLANRDKAPEAFHEDMYSARQLLATMPYAGVPWRMRSGKYIRRLTLERIRYYMYYRVTPERVEVVFFWHTSRRPPRL
jgi:plasmid stabilization system protein ParE